MGGKLQGGREAGKNIGLQTDELVWPLAVCPWLCAQVTYPFCISTRSLSENGDLNLKLHRIGLGVVHQQLLVEIRIRGAWDWRVGESLKDDGNLKPK